MKLGQIQTLIAIRRTDNGMYLAEEKNSSEQVLLPGNQVPKTLRSGDSIEVFLYKDSEDRPIATTTHPPLTLGGLAVLPVKETTHIGAFLNWGLTKDLFLPFHEQTGRIQAGDYILVSLYVDKSNRLCATMKVYGLLQTDSPYQKDDRVSGIVYEFSNHFGAFVAVDNRYSALIPKKELFQKVVPGDQITARVTDVLPDGKLNLSLREKAYLQIETDAGLIEERLKKAGGFLPFYDKSDAQDIQREFALSKNAFKRAVGHLLKEGKITLEDGGIRLQSITP